MYSAPATSRPTLPRRLMLLPAVLVVMVTSEFMVSPLLPDIAEAFGRPLGQASLLITALAVGQVVGGVTVGVVLARRRPSWSVAGLAVAFALAQAGPLLLTSWSAVLVSRVLAGVLMAATFTVALTAAAGMVKPTLTARASGVVFSGVTFGLTLGSPLAGWLGGAAGWQWPFVAVSVLGVVTGALTFALFGGGTSDATPPPATAPARAGSRVLRQPRLWATYLTGLLVIGAAASAYSFYGALLGDGLGFDPGSVSAVLLGFGVLSIAGNLAVARLGSSRPDRVIVVASVISAALYLVAAVGRESGGVLVALIVVLGALGFTLNPALVSLVVGHSGNRAITNALAATSVTLGIVVGSAGAGWLVDRGAGLGSPLVLAAALAAAAAVTGPFARVDPRTTRP